MPLLDVFCNGLKAKIDDLKKGLAVVCFTEDVKSILMWSHYANNHRGFCIEYKLAQTDLSKQIRKVIYSSERHYLRDEDLNEKGYLDQHYINPMCGNMRKNGDMSQQIPHG